MSNDRNSPNRTHNVGILGFGFIGKVHAYGYLNMPFFYAPPPLEAKITHVITSRQETAERAKRMIGAEAAGTDFRDVTENPEIDIVHICTPNNFHKDALLSALANGKHIYCDKPLTATAAEADEVRAALDGYRGTAQMTFHNRFFPATLRAKQLVEQGALGEILSFRACYLHGGGADPAAPLTWRLRADAGGGAIADLGSHVLDLIDWLIGPYESVMADTRIAYPERPLPDDPAQLRPTEVEDCMTCLAKMRGGALGTIEASKIAIGTEDELRIEIHGSRGALRYNGMDPHHLELHDASASDRPLGGTRGWNRINTGQRYQPPATGFPSPKLAIGWMRAHLASLANFLEAVAEGRPANPGLEQGVSIQRLMHSLRRSAAERRWVDADHQ